MEAHFGAATHVDQYNAAVSYHIQCIHTHTHTKDTNYYSEY
jgi:hypothetical protein